MGLKTMFHLHLVALYCTSLSGTAPVSKSFVVSVSTPVRVHSSPSTTLPCWLSPAISAEGLEVRWYRDDHFDTPLMLYRERKYDASQVASHVGRVSFGLKDATSAGLPAGDVSLKLQNVTFEDAGDYTCYVSSDHGYDSGSVRLNVIETGNSPILSVVVNGEGFNVSCESEGWFPRPRLQWSDREKDLSPISLEFTKASSGLESVHSSLVVSSLAEVSCSVGLSDEDTKETRVRLEHPPQLDKQESESSVAGWVAFAVVLLLMLVLLGAFFIRKKAQKEKSQRNQAEENEKLLKEVKPTALVEAETHYENIELQKTGNKYIMIKNHILRDSKEEFPDGKEAPCLTAVRGTRGFSSGKHYWEVSLGGKDEPKQSWWVGVTNAEFLNTRYQDVPPTSSNGSWFLSSSHDPADILQLSTEPKVSLPVNTKPEVIGVYLNYDGGELTFYNVQGGTVLGSLAVTFTGEVFPLFNPGKGDKYPMEILQRPPEVKGSDMNQNPGLAANEAH